MFLPFLGATTLIRGGRKTDDGVGGWARKGFIQKAQKMKRTKATKTNDDGAFVFKQTLTPKVNNSVVTLNKKNVVRPLGPCPFA